MNKDQVLRLLKHPVSYSVSLHVLFMIVFALWQLNVEPKKSWHSFEWFTQTTLFEPISPDKAHLTGSDVKHGLLTADELLEQISAREEASSSNIIEMPMFSQDSTATNDMDFLQDDLRLGIDGINSIGYGERALQLQGKSDAFFIREIVPAITPLMDDNVVVEFRLDREGKVLMSSINVVSYRRAEHYQSLRKAMEDWKFGFTGKYDPEQVYRIRCKFTVR